MSEEDNKTTEPVPDETTEPETTEQPEETEQEDIPPAAGDTLEPTTVLLKTNHGDIKIKLHEDMPITAGNFKKLVEEGFYDGLIFHRVIDGFMIQGGDPDGRGTGGPGYSIQDEFTDHNKNNRGTLSMANSGPNTGGSQFFINLVDNNYLDPKHPVFGEVIEGMDVVDVIAKVPKGAGDRPVEAVTIIEAKII
ncbi:MAG: peptidylprolyl isomerase [Nanoarchaeota archaeon]|nr:peptidylprolyl isomerase [Nanoarchaeota archaeon]